MLYVAETLHFAFGTLHLRDWVPLEIVTIAGFNEWIEAALAIFSKQSIATEREPFPKTIFLDGLEGVGRAGGLKVAARAIGKRDDALMKADNGLKACRFAFRRRAIF